MTQRNETGFSLIEGLFTILVITAVAFAGWYVWHSGKTTSPQAATTTTAKITPKATAPAADPTKDWITYTSASGRFSLRYPATWLTAVNQSTCDDNLLLLGPSKTTVAACNSDGGGEVMFMALDTDVRDSYKLTTEHYKDVTSQTVTVNGVQGTKLSGTLNDSSQLEGPQVGMHEVDYVFFTNGKTYVAQYTQEPTFPDVLSDFNLIVTKTLKFE